MSSKSAPAARAMASPKYKKAPDAPKRFKSAFIIFSAEKHKEIKERLASEGRAEKTTDIAKLVSEAWRELSPDDKEVWEKAARKDKARYEVEKAMYKGPWKVPANKRTPKDPSAPKRPMSAFLAFSNKRRAALKRQHPDATNADLSKMLSKTWKEAPDDLRQKYMDEEAELRQSYKVEMAKWRKKVAEEKRAERKEREALAMQAAENRGPDAPSLMKGGAGAAEVPGGPAGATGVAGGPPDGMPPQQPGYPGGMYGVPPYGMPHQNMGEMGFGGMQSQYPGILAGGPAFGQMNPQMGAQQQLLTQLLAGQPGGMSQFMPGRPPMGMYGQHPSHGPPNGQAGAGAAGGQGGPSLAVGQAGPPGYGMAPAAGAPGGSFGMEGGMAPDGAHHPSAYGAMPPGYDPTQAYGGQQAYHATMGAAAGQGGPSEGGAPGDEYARSTMQ